MKPTVEKRTKNAIAYLKKRLRIEADQRMTAALDDTAAVFDDIRADYNNAKNALGAVHSYFFGKS